MPTRIPAGLEVIVVDIGDSALAPHQCLRGGTGVSKFTYYHRQAGRSEPAPHFYLELLRQRLVNPVLEVKEFSFAVDGLTRQEGAIFLAARLLFTIENVGRVAAYKWQLVIYGLTYTYEGENRRNDFRVGRQQFPPGARSSGGGVRLDDTILPGTRLSEDVNFGVFLRPPRRTPDDVSVEIECMVSSVKISYRIATETSPGDLREVALRDAVSTQDLVFRYFEATK